MSADPVKGLYVQYGCGLSTGKGWLNYDNSPSVRIQRLPVIATLARHSQAVARFPAEVRYGDVCRGLLAPAGSCAGIYASHVLEHLSLEDFHVALRNTLAMLRPGGVFRLIVPDLRSRATKYLEKVDAGSHDASSYFMQASHLGQQQRVRGIVGRIREQIGNSRHFWMWDAPSMSWELEKAGFVAVRRCSFGDADDAMFKEVEDAGRFVDVSQGITELAIECRRPAQ